MKRHTIKTNTGYIVENLKSEDNQFSGEAINQLAKYENMVEIILQEQKELQEKIDKLKNPDSNKVHWRVKELMGKKLTNKGILLALKYHGIEVEE
ncbi:hypothetical protein [Anaerorhabdus sp.]|uniref:hypothetical protein n=1 Tax=Anaerorhabdus sp. TaxID=1872524 RepID=UPI002B2123C0|nr:hypothetical protein [Anaerorhabdus sp.]MEA4875811.1 hypothetical protein [Anaerorhabdus sp.]